jgi:broad specificity phosphatase PhoE
VSVAIVFETHSLSEDNELGLASGWTHGPLSARGRELARELGARRADDGFAAVFASDLWRARETAELAFAGRDLPVLLDWRLRECDYGELTRHPAAEVLDGRLRYLDAPYPGGESWRDAITRVGRFLADLRTWWDGRRVLVIGHVATRWGIQHACERASLEELATAEFLWQEGWQYELA